MTELSWALTVPQPAAWAVAHGHQDVYNRTYPTDRRGWLAICAGRTTDARLLADTAGLTGRAPAQIERDAADRDAIVAVARLTDVCNEPSCDCGPWAQPRYVHWRFADTVLLPEPVPAPRQVGVWRMPKEVADAVVPQWRSARRLDEPDDHAAVRDALLPLPATGHRRVLLLGTTGAGKTTVVRQLLGTDPETERFPSTSTAKTTVADTEIVLTPDGPYRAAVTFAGRAEVAAHLRDNVWEAARAVFRG
ncbi:hypothetical protein BJF79_13900, partial [Actinomadura sp. CNU-125]|uniref:hypothetical protein n=1 Tax=Actinomadura sp. CNU-125 TaxID=1904961 RepID=UPI00095F7672